MPGTPPRHLPGRDATRPGVRRGPRQHGGPDTGPEPVTVPEDATPAETAKAHADARSRVIATLALGVTHRVIALTATVAVLLISFVSSFSVYLGQQRDIAQTKDQIAQNQAQIASLQDQLQRWQDPAYIRAQARDQLGWVMPGEVGYRVIDANGQIIGGTVQTVVNQEKPASQPWYDTLWSSLQSADQPAQDPDMSTPAIPETIGPEGVVTPSSPAETPTGTDTPR